jgi:hypothetical protein
MPGLYYGQNPGWTGHVTTKVAVTASDVTTYDPPLRVLACTVSGTVVLVLADDATGTTITRTLVAGQELTYYAIKQVKAASTATVEGFR